nr:inositol monophosphatase [Lachnospiraceae bacterium]
YELMLSPWDYAAGALIVKEAGGSVAQYTNEVKETQEPLLYDRNCSVVAWGPNAEIIKRQK